MTALLPRGHAQFVCGEISRCCCFGVNVAEPIGWWFIDWTEEFWTAAFRRLRRHLQSQNIKPTCNDCWNSEWPQNLLLLQNLCVLLYKGQTRVHHRCTTLSLSRGDFVSPHRGNARWALCLLTATVVGRVIGPGRHVFSCVRTLSLWPTIYDWRTSKLLTLHSSLALSKALISAQGVTTASVSHAHYHNLWAYAIPLIFASVE